MNGTN